MSEDETEVEEFEEQQDWRFLNQPNALPRRGEKEYEPDGTGFQDSTLQESRAAMYTALQGERKHNGKTNVRATWYPELRQARVDEARGPYFATMGKSDSEGKQWLTFEEAIYLLERGSMEMWHVDGGPPMSLQAAYAACINDSRDIDMLHIYAYLKKIGFILLRAKDTYLDDTIEHGFSMSFSLPGLDWARQWLRTSRYSNCDILANRAVYRKYTQLYGDLDVVSSNRPPHWCKDAVVSTSCKPEQPFKVVYDVWKPASQFKKSKPGIPNYRIAVCSAQDSVMPSLAQATALLENEPVNEAMNKKNQNQKLKEGWRNVILALNDGGIVSFFRLCDVAFGDESIVYDPDTQKKPPQKNRNNNKNKNK